MTRYFRPSPAIPAIYPYRDLFDFRKSYRELAALVLAFLSDCINT